MLNMADIDPRFRGDLDDRLHRDDAVAQFLKCLVRDTPVLWSLDTLVEVLEV